MIDSESVPLTVDTTVTTVHETATTPNNKSKTPVNGKPNNMKRQQPSKTFSEHIKSFFSVKFPFESQTNQPTLLGDIYGNSSYAKLYARLRNIFLVPNKGKMFIMLRSR